MAACSYEARTFGIHSAMPMAEALRRCPRAIVVHHHMERYAEASRRGLGSKDVASVYEVLMKP